MSVSLGIDILLFVGAAQGLLLGTVLFTLRRGRRAANRILGFLLLVFSAMIFFHTLADVQQHSSVKESHVRPNETVVLFFGPLFYLYARALTESSFVPRLREILHAIPFAVAFLSAIALRASDTQPPPILKTLLPLAIIGQMIIYFVGMLRILKGFEHRMQQDYSSLDLVNLRWLRFFTIAQFCIWPIAAVVEVAGGTSKDWNYVWLLISCFIYAIGYWGLRQPEIFGVASVDGPPTPAKPVRKYEKSALTAEMAATLRTRLGNIMAGEKPYLNSGLTLPLLARLLNVSPHLLSQVLNEQEGMTFYEYVNGFRVEEARRLLSSDRARHLTIAAVGFDAGFNSVSSFNAVFKKHTGMSPSQFRQSNANTQSPSPFSA